MYRKIYSHANSIRVLMMVMMTNCRRLCIPLVTSDQRFSCRVLLIPPWEGQCEWYDVSISGEGGDGGARASGYTRAHA